MIRSGMELTREALYCADVSMIHSFETRNTTLGKLYKWKARLMGVADFLPMKEKIPNAFVIKGIIYSCLIM